MEKVAIVHQIAVEPKTLERSAVRECVPQLYQKILWTVVVLKIHQKTYENHVILNQIAVER